VIGTGGDNHTASVEKFICREIPMRENVIVANRKTAMPRPKNSEYHNAYNAGWNASNRTTTYDMQSALERYKGPHEDHFDMGWTDHASDYAHRFRKPDQFLEKYRAENSPHYDDFELHPETRELVRSKQASRRISRDDDPIIKYTEDDDETRPRKVAKDGGCTCWEGYERVPGTKPCADGSCRKKSNRERRYAKRWTCECGRDDNDDARCNDCGGWGPDGPADNRHEYRESASRRRGEKVTRHNLSDPGPLGKGKDDKMPTIKEDLGDEWYRHGPGGKWVARKKTR
jgi:hypothetical protein